MIPHRSNSNTLNPLFKSYCRQVLCYNSCSQLPIHNPTTVVLSVKRLKIHFIKLQGKQWYWTTTVYKWRDKCIHYLCHIVLITFIFILWEKNRSFIENVAQFETPNNSIDFKIFFFSFVISNKEILYEWLWGMLERITVRWTVSRTPPILK